MPGSKSEVTLVLLYDGQEDTASWAIKSAAILAARAYPHRWTIIWDNYEEYEYISKMAGEKPQMLVEETVQPKQGDTSETQEDSE
jgi:hypothetical protein